MINKIMLQIQDGSVSMETVQELIEWQNQTVESMQQEHMWVHKRLLELRNRIDKLEASDPIPGFEGIQKALDKVTVGGGVPGAYGTLYGTNVLPSIEEAVDELLARMDQTDPYRRRRRDIIALFEEYYGDTK